jgi:alginate O-acetyltransferase complex protein AlgI
MVFSSTIFLFYFLPLFLISYILIDKKYKNYLILAFSFFFYQWGAPRFVYLLLTITLIDFFIVNKLHESEGIKRKLFLIISLLLNTGLLCYFKYSNFFIENVNLVLNNIGVKQVEWTAVVLPIGISFFLFETLTYSIDVYRRVHAPLKSVFDYFTYILLFPKLIAGPIVRFHEIADQISDRSTFENTENRFLGLTRFIIGLSKKVFIANTMGKLADDIFMMDMNSLGTTTAWIGIIAYSFQIYFDFSGYSDMAIGLGRFMGFKFIENFNNPYISQNISEFWRRWHMSLGRWMKDYLYIPLGGNKGSKFKMFFNLWIVFVISGLWHGAAWNFVIWGMFHGFFLILDRLFLVKILSKLGRIFSIAFTYIITLIGWVLFRAESIVQAKTYITKMFVFNTSSSIKLDNQTITMLLFGVLFSFFALIKNTETKQMDYYNGMLSKRFYLISSPIVILLLILSLSYVISSGFNPFIYFRF